MEEKEVFADIILPLAVKSVYTYKIPEGKNLYVGSRVTVPLGKNKYYTGIICRIHNVKPDYTVKEVINSDDLILATQQQLKLWFWISEYYLCETGEVFNCAIPSKFKLSGNNEFLNEKFRYKTANEYYIDPELSYKKKEEINFGLKKFKRQYELFSLLKSGPVINPDKKIYGAIKSLEKKGIVKKRVIKINRTLDNPVKKMIEFPTLSEKQTVAFKSIVKGFSANKTVLLHGITGSGKTEIYINLIKDVLSNGKDVLYMLPEIAVASQLIKRLKEFFGGKMLVYHSRINNNLRAEIYLNLLEKDKGPALILGVRSSIFLPFRNLGLIIVDEEHEISYKQQEPAPRYHARDCAIILGKIFNANVLLGSATPSIETYFNALNKKYHLVELKERFHKNEQIRYIIADIIRSAKRGEKISHFTIELLREIEKTISKNRQALLFQNRRGYSPYMECQECGYTFFCSDCNVSMTYHKRDSSLVCHYCGRKIPVPKRCAVCNSEDIKTMGFGTEKIEEELSSIIPGINVARLDLDTVSSNKMFHRIISDFESGKINILVGTQMIIKGFDFKNLILSGILNADNLLNIPDFRAQERSFQMLTQVAGRAGRRNEEGIAVIQTSQPDNPIILQVKNNDYSGMFNMQLKERQRFLYPPFCRLISFTLKNKNKEKLNLSAEIFAKELRHVFGKRLLGPDFPVVDKIRNEFICSFLLKIEKEKSFSSAKIIILKVINKLRYKLYGSSIITNVDPQ